MTGESRGLGVCRLQDCKMQRRMLVFLEAEFFDFLDQRSAIHMQQDRRLALDPLSFRKGLQKELFFKGFNGGVKIDPVLWDIDTRDMAGGTGAEDFLGEVFRRNHAAAFQDSNAFYSIFELAHIARPVIVFQHLQGFWCDPRQMLLFLSIKTSDKMRHQQRDIRQTLPQGWQSNGNDIEAPIQIIAELLAGHEVFKILIGGGDDTDIHFNGADAANALKLAFLEDAQNFDLQCRAHLSDFVEENSATVGQLKAPHA